MKTATDTLRVNLSDKDRKDLLSTLKTRFENNMKRHEGLDWDTVQSRLESNPDKLWSLHEMEATGGEPDAIGKEENGKITFVDCSPETPAGRRNICYDHEGEQERIKKGINPGGNAVDIANETGIDILTEEQYRKLQKFGKFDTRTSSWIKTPPDIRKAGGALFADFRYGHVFIYHNSAPSFYSSRAFRGLITI